MNASSRVEMRCEVHSVSDIPAGGGGGKGHCQQIKWMHMPAHWHKSGHHQWLVSGLEMLVGSASAGENTALKSQQVHVQA